jgi:hypothetical protein
MVTPPNPEPAAYCPDKMSNTPGGWDFEATRWMFLWMQFVSCDRPKIDFFFGWRNHGKSLLITFFQIMDAWLERKPHAELSITHISGESTQKVPASCIFVCTA